MRFIGFCALKDTFNKLKQSRPKLHTFISTVCIYVVQNGIIATQLSNLLCDVKQRRGG